METQKSVNQTILWVGIATVLAGLGYWVYNQFYLAMKYCYKIRDVKFNAVGLNRTNLTIFLAIRNFSSINATVKKLDLQVFINDVPVTKIIEERNIEIKANGVSDVTVGVEFSIKEILKTNIVKATQLVSDMINNKEKVLIKTKGTIAVQAGFINFKDINIDISMSMKDILADDPNAFVCDIV